MSTREENLIDFVCPLLPLFNSFFLLLGLAVSLQPCGTGKFGRESLFVPRTRVSVVRCNDVDVVTWGVLLRLLLLLKKQFESRLANAVPGVLVARCSGEQQFVHRPLECFAIVALENHGDEPKL